MAEPSAPSGGNPERPLSQGLIENSPWWENSASAIFAMSQKIQSRLLKRRTIPGLLG